jgi:hypothetical protein
MQKEPYQNETLKNSPTQACSQLLRAIVRPSVTDAQICKLAQDIGDWNELLRVSKAQRILPLLSTRLAQANAELPPEAEQYLELEHQHNTFHCMANVAELIAILDVFKQHAICAMPFKGVALAASVYGDANARASGDLDLLVYTHDLKHATELLLHRGYEVELPENDDLSQDNLSSYEYHFERPRDGMVTELRTRLELFGPRSDRSLGMDWVWPQRQSVCIAGAAVPDINAETTLLILCMHGSKHAWTRLSWIVDVAQLLMSHSDLNWRTIDVEAKRTGLRRTLVLGVLLAHRIANAPVPQDVLRRFASVSAVRTLVEYIDANLLDPALRRPPGFVPYSMRILDFRDWLRLCLTLELFKPGSRDRAFVKLPRPLRALYYLVRPLRLLIDRSSR